MIGIVVGAVAAATRPFRFPSGLLHFVRRASRLFFIASHIIFFSFGLLLLLFASYSAFLIRRWYSRQRNYVHVSHIYNTRPKRMEAFSFFVVFFCCCCSSFDYGDSNTIKIRTTAKLKEKKNASRGCELIASFACERNRCEAMLSM